jgi:hypothetical protein
MIVTPEELAAFADGELDTARAAEVAAAVAADPALEAQVKAHRALKARLGAHFAPIMEAPVPERLASLLRPEPAQVVDFAAAREKRERARTLPRWSWIVGPALAASLALAVFVPRGGSYIEGPLAVALENQLVANQAADAETRILLSFRTGEGNYCRAFTAADQSGIACREEGGWALAENLQTAVRQAGEYRQAGSDVSQLMEHAQAMAAGPALDPAQEQAAKARGWR